MRVHRSSIPGGTKSSHQGKKNVTFFHFVSIYLYEMVDVEQIYCDNHFMIFVSQIIMLYTLNLYTVVCQLHLSKIGRKKNNYNLYFDPESLPDLTISLN